MNDLLFYFGILTLLYVIVIVAGHSIHSFFRLKENTGGERLATDLLLGLLVISFGYAMLKTSGVSIMAGLLIPVLFFAQRFKSPSFVLKEILNAQYLKYALGGLVACFIFSSLEFSWLYDASTGKVINVPHYDFLYYARLSNFLHLTGGENMLFLQNLIEPGANRIREPYHYPELWLNAFAISLTGKTGLKTLMLVIYPLLKGIFISMVAIFIRKHFLRFKTYQAILAGIILSGITAFYFSFYKGNSLLQYYDGITQSGVLMSFGRKYLFMAICFAYAMFFLLPEKRYMAFFSLIAINSLFSVGGAPGIFCVLMLGSSFLLYRKELSRGLFFRIWIVTLLIFGFQFAFYSVFADSGLNKEIRESLWIHKMITQPDISLVKAFVFSFAFPLIRVVSFYLPYLLLIVFLIRKRLRFEILFPLLLVFLAIAGGNSAASFASGSLDNGQFLYNALPLMNVVLIYVFILIFSNQEITLGQYRMVFASIAVLTFAYHMYCDINHYSGAIKPYNQIAASVRLLNSEKIEASSGAEIIKGLYRDESGKPMNRDYRDSQYRFGHFYLQYLQRYTDVVNIGIDSCVVNTEKLNPVDRFLLQKNEYYKFLIKEKKPIGEASLTGFVQAFRPDFIAEGDKIYLMNEH